MLWAGQRLWWACGHLSPGLAEWLVWARCPALAWLCTLSSHSASLAVCSPARWRWLQYLNEDFCKVLRAAPCIEQAPFWALATIFITPFWRAMMEILRQSGATEWRRQAAETSEGHGWNSSGVFPFCFLREFLRVKHNAASSMIQSLRSSEWLDLKIKNPKHNLYFS